MNNLILALLGIFFHEAGHYYAMKYFGCKKPNVRFIKWVLAIEVGQKQFLHLTKKQHIIVLWSGILLGLPFFMVSGTMMFIYMLMSSVDLIVFIFLMFNKMPFTSKMYHVYLDMYKRNRLRCIREYKESAEDFK